MKSLIRLYVKILFSSVVKMLTYGVIGRLVQNEVVNNAMLKQKDEAITKLNINTPNYIKKDVDGLEHFILRGGESVLKKINGILIEVNDNFIDQAQGCYELLTEAGLSLYEKKTFKVDS